MLPHSDRLQLKRCNTPTSTKLSFAGSALRLARFNLEWLQQS
jgi:hypothetical protein